MFEFLFKYPVEYFVAGDLVSVLPAWQLALLAPALAALVFVALGTLRLRGRARMRDRIVIALFRGLALAAIVFSLSRPLLEVTSPLPQPGVVGVLLDNSISMNLEGPGQGRRGAFIRQQLDAANGPLLEALRHRFDLRLFRFGSGTEAIDSVDALDFSDGDSDLPPALKYVRESLRGDPLAGIVVISDGALKPSRSLDAELLALRSARIPVYGVGLGAARYPHDVEISGVRLPQTVLNGSRIMAEVSIRQQGYDEREVELLVEDDSSILHKQRLNLRPGLQSVRIPLETRDAGARRLEFRLVPASDESIAANNHREAVLDVDDRRMRILYYEGEPRFEMKFVRRAVSDDDNIGVTGLIRTADAKYYRVGIENPDQLRDGFPTTRDELFAYDAIILGSVEAALLSREQQQLIFEFVNRRGGGLLLLGGRRAFTEGGHRDSMLRELSPVVMPQRAEPDFKRSVKVQPTEAAWVHPALLLAASKEKSIERWLTLPPLTIVNPIRQTRPGATTLLHSAASDRDDPWVVMAWHRYGRGKVVAFAVQNSWAWQMHPEIELEDQTHELLWRQLLRWLVEDVPQRMDLTLSAHRVHTGGSIELRGEVLNPDFTPVRDQSVRAVVTAPDGVEQVIPLTPHPALPGIFETRLPAKIAGDHLVRVELGQADAVSRSAQTRFRVSPDGDEYFHSEMNQALMRRIALESNGGFYRPDDVDRLLDTLDDNLRAVPTLVRHELWDMPLLFLLLVSLLVAEWGYRRWRGQP